MSPTTFSYYTGGLAELVSHPSDVTYSYLHQWFTGAASLGRGMKLLGLPYEPVQRSVVVLHEGELVVDIPTELATLYQKTIFTYAPQQSPHDPPKVIVAYGKIINPINWLGTLQILKAQSLWLAKPDQIVDQAKQWITDISTTTHQSLSTVHSQLSTINSPLSTLEIIWPTVIAIGTLAEFFSTVIFKETSASLARPPLARLNTIQDYVNHEVARRDWFFLSLKDQALVKTKKLSFTAYMERFGMRADNDYELTCPRWWEIPREIQQRIDMSSVIPGHAGKPGVHPDSHQGINSAEGSQNNNGELLDTLSTTQKSYINAMIELQILRSEAKRLALVGINALRQTLLKQNSLSHTSTSSGIPNIVRSEAENLPAGRHGFSLQDAHVSASLRSKNIKTKNSGHGIGVSPGEITGQAIHITHHTKTIPKNAIGIFPNASPEYARYYTQCIGMIFLQGGRTSHGAIVSREYGIPALIDPKATIEEGKTVSIDGTTGIWEIIAKQ